MLLSIAVSGGHQLPEGGQRFSPGDAVNGHVRLESARPLDLDTVSVTFLGEQEGKAIAQGVDPGWLNAKLLDVSQELYRRDRYAGDPHLEPGTYTWSFRFAFPELPDNWSTQKLQSRYPASFLFIDDSRRSLVFTRYVLLAKAEGSNINKKVEEKVLFWPTRRLSMHEGPLPTLYRRRLEYLLPRQEPTNGRKWLPKVKKRDPFTLTAKLYIPRIHVIGHRLPLQIELQINPEQSLPRPARPANCQLTTMRLQLFAITKTGHQEPMIVKSVNVVQQKLFADLSIDLPLSDHRDNEQDQSRRVNLHDALPEPGFLISVEPWRNMAPQNFGGEVQSTPGPIVPSFVAPLCTRSYIIDAMLTVTCAGKEKSILVKSEELVLLPDRLDPKLAGTAPPAQLDVAGEVGRFEAPSEGLLEAAGSSTLQVPMAQLDAEGETARVEAPDQAIYEAAGTSTLSARQHAPMEPTELASLSIDRPNRHGAAASELPA